MIYDVIVIGGGPGGMTAALNVLRSGKTVLVLERENFGGQIANSPRVENIPSIKEISGLDFADQLFNQIMDLGAEFELEEVIALSKENDLFTVTTNYGTHLAKSVIIANGVSHRKMNLPKEEEFIGKGISFCAVCDGAFYKGQEVYLIGDANTALQYALLLANYCSKVHVITLFDRFFADQILIDRVLANDIIDVRHNLNLIEYNGEVELTGLTFEDTVSKEKVHFDTNIVFVAIGQIPHNEIFKDYVDLEKGFIITDENMETKTKNLFAAGDTRKKAFRQVITAESDGAIAAINATK